MPAVGSSSSKRAGSPARARPRSSHCRCPWASVCAGWDACGASPVSSRMVSTLRSRAVRPPVRQVASQIFSPCTQPLEQRRNLGLDRNVLSCNGVRRHAGDIHSPKPHMAAIRAKLSGQAAKKCGFSGAVRADQTPQFSSFDADIHVVDSDHSTKLLREFVNFEERQVAGHGVLRQLRPRAVRAPRSSGTRPRRANRTRTMKPAPRTRFVSATAASPSHVITA